MSTCAAKTSERAQYEQRTDPDRYQDENPQPVNE
jgi:hypothetical protein